MPMTGRRGVILAFVAVLLALCFCKGTSALAQNTPKVQPQPAPEADARPELEKVRSLRASSMISPKSVLFSPDGRHFYVNALEAMATLVYDSSTFEQVAIINHDFGEEEQGLFLDNESMAFDFPYLVPLPQEQRNCFAGKPVEGELTHNGRYLWVTYYRRTYDPKATSPSAVAIIDTGENKIVRVMPTGPLPKMITASPDGTRLAITHWGDNSVALMDISGDDPFSFHYIGLLRDGKQPDLTLVGGDRDSNCGYCLRGTAFSADGRYLFVGRMRGGGIAVFDTRSMTRAGIFWGVDPTPRHIVLSRDGKTLYTSCPASGTINALEVEKVLASLTQKEAPDGTQDYRGRSLRIAMDLRTLALSPDDRWIYVVSNRESKLAVVDALQWKVLQTVAASPYPVGLAVHPRGDLVLTTSQGRNGVGGHVMDVFAVKGIAPLPVPEASPAGEGQTSDKWRGKGVVRKAIVYP